MKLSNLFSQLAYGEFAQLNLADESGGTVAEKHRARTVAHINQGLIDLHTRFRLKVGEASLNLAPGQRTYMLPREDLVQIDEVWLDGLELLQGATSGPPLATLTSDNQILLGRSLAVSSGTLQVMYRRCPPALSDAAEALLTPETVEVDLPQTHQLALLYFCGSRVHNPLGMVNEANLGNLYTAKYEAECTRLGYKGLELSQDYEDNRFHAKGFV